MNEEQKKELEIRLSSNIYFLEELMRIHSNLTVNENRDEIENGQPEFLSEIIEDLEDIRKELE